MPSTPQNDNLIGIISGVASIEECKQYCLDSETDCGTFTYYGQEGAPFLETCLLYTECYTLSPCQDCYTQELKDACSLFCNAPIEGLIGDNLIRVIGDIYEENSCVAECQAEDACLFYTYHPENSTVYKSTCFLLSFVSEPITYCDNNTCSTGNSNCQDDNICGYIADRKGAISNGLMINKIKQTSSVGMVRIGICPNPIPIAVAVGGGD